MSSSTVSRIAIMGTPMTSGNRGVLALAASLVGLCAEAAPEAEIVILGSHPKPEVFMMRARGRMIPVRVVHWRMSPKSAWRDHLFMIVGMSFLYRCLPIAGIRRRIAAAIPWIAAVEKSDIVGDIRGGDSFSDIYGLKRFAIATLPILSVIWVKGGIVQFPQTYGPFKGRIARAIARIVLRRSTTIIARDQQSRQTAQDLVGNRREVLLSPDVAFSLEAIQPETIELDPPAASPVSAAPAIGLNVNGLMYNGGYTGKNMFGLKLDYRAFLPELATALLREHPGELWLVPHTFAPDGDVESDPEASRRLRAALPPELQRRVRVVSHAYDQHEIKGVIGQCEFFVGSRMHACIAALSQGVPCVGVAYSKKFLGVFESIGMAGWVVDGRSTGNDAAIEAVLTHFRQRSLRRQALLAEVDAARGKLRSIFAALCR